MKTIKRLPGLLVCLSLLALLCACGAPGGTPATQATAPKTTEAPRETAQPVAAETVTEAPTEPPTEPTETEDPILQAEGTVCTPVSGRLGEGVGGTQDNCVFKVSFVGAEFFRADGQEMARVYYDVENCASWIIPASDVKVVAVQDGDYLWNDTDEVHSMQARLSGSDMRPGVKARFAAEFNCRWDGGPIYAEAYYYVTFGTHYLDAIVYPAEGAAPAEIEPGLYDDSLIAVFAPADMPCRPASEDPRVAVTSPDLGGLPEEAALKMGSPGTMKITDAAFVDGVTADRAIEIHAVYTNTSGADESFVSAGYEIRVMQDGLELRWDGDPYDIYYDEAMNRSLPDGESVELTFRYCLFTDTPVTVEFCEWADDEARCGKVFPVA